MKKYLYVLILIICIILLFPKAQTPYSGNYYASGINESLVLKADNSFDINIVSYKNDVTISGKYRISNNVIDLISKDKSDTFFINNSNSSGKITGSVITFVDGNNGSPTVFTKY